MKFLASQKSSCVALSISPVANIYRDSDILTNILTSWHVVSSFCCSHFQYLLVVTNAIARTWWSSGLDGSAWVSKVSQNSRIPEIFAILENYKILQRIEIITIYTVLDRIKWTTECKFWIIFSFICYVRNKLEMFDVENIYRCRKYIFSI